MDGIKEQINAIFSCSSCKHCGANKGIKDGVKGIVKDYCMHSFAWMAAEEIRRKLSVGEYSQRETWDALQRLKVRDGESCSLWEPIDAPV